MCVCVYVCVCESLSMCQKSVCVCQKTVYAFAKKKFFVTVRISMWNVSVKNVCVLVCICTYVQIHVKSLYFCVNLFKSVCVCMSF